MAVGCSALKGETVPDSLPATPKSPPTRRVPPRPGKAGISGLHSRLPRGVRPRLEGKPRTPLSSRVATRVSWSPLSVKERKLSDMGA